MAEIKCCCVILNYNDAITTAHLLKEIESFDILDYIVVVDNQSTDDSFKRLSAYANRKVHIIVSDHNGGYGYGNNFGVKYAKENLECSYALIANPDVEFTEETVQAMLQCLVNNERGALAAPVQLDVNNDRIRDLAWKVPTIFQYIYTAGCFGGKFLNGFHYPKGSFIKPKAYEVDCVPGSLLLVDTAVFLEVGGYDDEMFLYCEETTLGFKLKSHRYVSYLLVGNEYIHRHSVSIDKEIKGIRQKKHIFLQSRLIFLKKYLHANVFQYAIAKFIYAIAESEQILLQIVYSLKQKKIDRVGN